MSAAAAAVSKEKSQLIKELFKPIRRKFPRRRTIIKGLDDLWQADLGQMDLYKNENKGYKYFLIVIDCFSKFVWIKALKSKMSGEVTKAFANILEKSNRHPRNLHTDRGTEFYSRDFQCLMKQYDINHYSTYTEKKAALVERSIRTIKEKLYKYFSLNGTYKWIDILSDIVNGYNMERHSVTKMRPCDVSKKNERKLLQTVYSHMKISTNLRKFKAGDVVRISKAKHVFEKGYTPKWTTELFRVVNVKVTDPVTYLLEDMNGQPISGAFYEQELQKTKQNDV
jgi:hypothetical protein